MKFALAPNVQDQLNSYSASVEVAPTGSATPILVLVNVPQAKWSFPILEQPQIIGRSRKADIQTPGRFSNVSRRHAEIWRDDEAIWIRDLNSRAGTHVNRIWLRALNAVKIATDDRIWVGGVELEVASSLSSAATRAELTGNDDDTTSCSDQMVSRQLLEDLTPAELVVVYCLGRGKLLDEEIGLALGRSPHTVRTQLASIFQKIGVHSRGELLGWLKRISGGEPG